MLANEAKALAQKCGFDGIGVIQASDLKFLTEVRDMCSMDKCNKYNKSWTCPPACGSLEEISVKAKKYNYGIVVQTVGKLEDPFDFPTMVATEKIQKERFDQLLNSTLEKEESVLPMGVGTCTLCDKCTYPDKPCRFPEKAFPSMEAYGLMVTDTCINANLPYNYGEGTIAYTSMILFK